VRGRAGRPGSTKSATEAIRNDYWSKLWLPSSRCLSRLRVPVNVGTSVALASSCAGSIRTGLDVVGLDCGPALVAPPDTVEPPSRKIQNLDENRVRPVALRVMEFVSPRC
jgi:hypothetical protein